MSDHTPRYRVIAADLRAAIASGRYAPGTHLPTEQDLTVRYGVSRHTAREALQLLRQEGLIARRRGIGAIVSAADPSGGFSQALNGLSDLLQYAREARLQVRAIRPATLADIARLATEDARGWTAIHGKRCARGRPIALTRILVRADLCPPRDAIDAFEGALNELIAARSAVRPAQIDQEISAVTLTEREAEQLEAQHGAAALATVRRYRDQCGATFQASYSVHPADRFTYKMRLDRT
jgi:GntR family transcriptional regulator